MRESEPSSLLKLVVPGLDPEQVARRFLVGAVGLLEASAAAIWWPERGAGSPGRLLAAVPEDRRVEARLAPDHPIFAVLKRTPATAVSATEPPVHGLLGAAGEKKAAVLAFLLDGGGALAMLVPDRRAFPVHRVHALKEPLERLGLALRQAAAHQELEAQVKELRKQLAATQHTAGRMRALVENSLDLLYVLGYDGSIQMVSPSVTESTGLTADELEGQSIFTFLHPEDVEPFMQSFRRRLLQRGLGAPEEIRLKGAAGWRWVTARLNNRLDDPKVGGVILACHDITRLKENAARLEEARRAAEEASQARGAFLANMSHEIRTPLNSVIGMASLLEETQLDEQQREMLATIRASGESLVGIINQVLDLARIEAGELVLRPEPVDLLELVEEVLEVAAPLAAEKGLELLADVPPHVPRPLLVDRQRLQQILLNLVTNAVKHTERGLILVSGSVSGPTESPRLDIAVRDTGHGIHETELERIFRPFGQTEEGRAEGGTGLGLTITRQLVEALGGSIGVTSAVGRGSTFTVSLPMTPAEGAGPGTPGDLLEGRTVLLDVPCEEAASIYSAWLRSEGARVVTPPAPGDQPSPSLVVLDAARQPESAMERLRSLRDELGGAELPAAVLLPLGAAPPEDMAGVGVVYKPVRRSRLLEAVLEQLGAAEPTGPAPQEEDVHGRPKRRLRVLLAEDNPLNRRVAMMMLERLDHQVDAVASGPEVVDAVRSGSYDVVLMDLELPGFGGLEAARRIRELTLTSHPAIVAMTGHVLPADRERCFAAGMDGFLAKPVVLEDLRRALDQVPGAPSGPAPREEPVEDQPVDAARLREIASVTPGLLEQLVDLFSADAPERIAAIAGAAGAGNLHEVAQSAHQLKGAAANMGARRLEELARQVENLARTGRKERLLELVPQLEQVLRETRTALEEAVAADDHGFVQG